MILPFSTTINGKPTRFVEKIWEAIFQKGIQFNAVELNIGKEALPKGYVIKTNIPKLHTIRKDKNDRWKAGVMIDFFINTRTKDMYRFAPRIPVVSTQKIRIAYNKGGGVNVFIDDKFFYYQTSFGLEWDKETKFKMFILAQNDGFDTVEEFFEDFNEDFSGKIIHWTDLKY